MGDHMLYIVTALYNEAKPLIEWYNLKRDMSDAVFQVFSNNDINLIITGVGKINSAIGTAHLLSTKPVSKEDSIVNIGICGSLTGNLGEIYIINKVKDHETGKDFYPDVLLKHPFCEASIETFSYPLTDRSQLLEDLCDMEGSGFFQAASKYLDVHRICIIKIVSDRLDTKLIDKRFIEKLIKEKMPLIDSFLLSFKDTLISDHILSEKETQEINEICSNMRLTESQRLELIKMCMQYKSRTRKELDFLGEYKGLKVMTKDERSRYFRSLLKRFETF